MSSRNLMVFRCLPICLMLVRLLRMMPYSPVTMLRLSPMLMEAVIRRLLVK
ncbi:hypothetical protein Hdeb2414_s0205g00832101 [Helianthus debilis subsp. tardiflorus]